MPGDLVVYRGHGIGRVKAVELENFGGHLLRCIIIAFEQDGMVLRLPWQKAHGAGLRPVASKAEMDEALLHLAVAPAPASGIWNRRMVEYTAKINSGDLFAVVEVVRALHRPALGKSRSPGAQMIYERALVRLGSELAAVERTDPVAAATKLDLLLSAA